MGILFLISFIAQFTIATWALQATHDPKSHDYDPSIMQRVSVAYDATLGTPIQPLNQEQNTDSGDTPHGLSDGIGELVNLKADFRSRGTGRRRKEDRRRRDRRRRSKDDSDSNGEGSMIETQVLAKQYCRACRRYTNGVSRTLKTWDRTRHCFASDITRDARGWYDLTNDNADSTCYRPMQSNVPPEFTDDDLSAIDTWLDSEDAQKVCSCILSWIKDCPASLTDCIRQKICGCPACATFKQAWGCSDGDLLEAESTSVNNASKGLTSSHSLSAHQRRTNIQRSDSQLGDSSKTSMDSSLQGKCG